MKEGLLLKEPLNKSHAGATTALRDGMRERRRREWLFPFARSPTKQIARKARPTRVAVKSGATAKGQSSAFHRKVRPRSGMRAPKGYIISRSRHPPLPDPRFAGPLGRRFWAPLRYTPWHRRPSYDLRRAPCDHPDFTRNALRGGFVQRFLSLYW